MALKLETLSGNYCVCRLEPDAEVPGWVTNAGSHSFVSVTRTAEELSLFVPQEVVPAQFVSGALDRDWCGFKLVGPFEFTEVGILVQLLVPLRDVGIPMLAMSTFDTDFVFVKSETFDRTVACFKAAGLELV